MQDETESAWYPGITEKHFEHAIQDAVRTEREACAKVADKYTCGTCGMDGKAGREIRERSNNQIEGRD